MNINSKNGFIRLFVIIYFINAVIEVIAESISYKPIIYITKPLIPFLLMILFYYTSEKKSILFFLIMFFSLVTNLLFMSNKEEVSGMSS